MTIHPQIIEKEGKKEFVVISYEEFQAIQEALDDFEDLKMLRAEQKESANESTRSLSEVLQEIGGPAGI